MFDAVVIGAGLSGLSAAYTAQQCGLSVVVVEARNRVGGKTWSVPLASGRGCADLGAAWINDTTQPRIWSYAQRFGLKVVKQRLQGRAVMHEAPDARIEYSFGITPELLSQFALEDRQDLERIRDHIQAESLKQEMPNREDDSISLDQYVCNLGARPKTVRMINLWSQVMHGVESSEQPAAWFIDYCRRNGGLFSIRADDSTGGNYLRFQEGAQSIANGIARLVGSSNIHLSCPIVSVRNQSSHVDVVTTNGKTFKARKCILSIPSTMYKELSFEPPLPASTQEVANGTILGDYNKAIICYDRPWWRDAGFNGYFLSYTGPITLARDTSVDEKRHYSLTCFVNGQFGRDWAKLPPHERRAVVLKQVAHVFNADLESEVFKPIEVFDQIWKHEQFSRGALAPITALGHLTKFASVYGKAVGNIHFVGTEYAQEWKGYMEGALRSGEDGAKEVMEALKQAPLAKL